MTKHLSIEEVQVKKELLLIVDFNKQKNPYLTNLVIDKFENKTNLYLLSDNKKQLHVKKISPLGLHLIDRVREEINYSIVLLLNTESKDKLILALDKLVKTNAKVVLISFYVDVFKNLDILIKYKQYENISFLLVGDLFGEKYKDNFLSRIIIRSFLHRKVSLDGKELMPIYPIYESDFINSIEYVLFSKNRNYKFFKVFYEKPSTLISLVHELRKVEPELSAEFKLNKNIKGERNLINEDNIKARIGNNLVFIKYGILGFEKSVIQMHGGKLNATGKSSNFKKYTNSKEKNLYKIILKLFNAVLIAGFFYITCMLLMFILSFFLLKQGYKYFEKGDVKKTVSYINASNTLYSLSNDLVYTIMSTPFFPAEVGNSLSSYQNIQNELPFISKILRKLINNSEISKNDILRLISTLNEFYFSSYRNGMPDIKKIQSIWGISSFSKMASIFSVLNNLLGYDNEKSYLILFQNENELRPNGGFIGSVGFLKVKNGKINSLNISDVYELDGQLKGHVEPHYIIRKYLQPNLYLRDSNFNPSFENSASTSAFLYSAETNNSVDGVIALDTQVLKEILKIVGPINIPGISESITSENAVSLMQDSIHSDFFPGSTQKKNILSTIMNKVIFLIESDKGKQIKLLGIMPRLIEEKHILFSSPISSVQKAFIASNAAGSLADIRNISNKAVYDFLSINEANIGVNKINAYVDRKIEYSATFKNNEIYSDISLVLKNSGNEIYKTYVRFIVPSNSQINQIIIDSEVQKIIPAITDPKVYERTAFISPKGLEVDSEVITGHKSYGFVVDVLPFSKKDIHFTYNTAYPSLSLDSFEYSLYYVKQPGTKKYPLKVNINTGELYKKTGKDVLFNGEIVSDNEFKTNIYRVK